MPPPAPKMVEDYLSQIPEKLDAIPRSPAHANMTREELKTIKQLQQDDRIVIKQADKGSCIVVENKEDYISDGLAHLADTDIYEEIPEDYTTDIAKALNTTVRKALDKGHINKDMSNFLMAHEPTEVRTQQMYFLKKLHKDPVQVRPIVSGVSGPTEKASSFLDHYVQPLVPLTASYTKDSTAILRLLEDTHFPQDVILATVDVKALYLNIPHQEGTDCLINHLFKDNPNAESLPFPEEFVRSLLNGILKHNVFEFNSRMFRQTRGTAMGTKVAPAYANLFLDSIETEFLAKQPVKPLVWRRFIDDIFIVWPSTEESLIAFLERLNDSHTTIKYTWTISKEKVTFLDLDISKSSRFKLTGKLDTAIHFKPTNKFQYLAFTSSHPRSVHKGLIKGEMTRILRATSNQTLFQEAKTKIARALIQRGYPRKLVKDIGNTIKFEDRNAVLQHRNKDQLDTEPPAFVCTYHPQISRRELRAALQPPEDIPLVPRICYKRNKNIADKVVRARLKNTATPSKGHRKVALTSTLTWRLASAPCGQTNCLCCQQMSRQETVFTSDGRCSFKLPLNTTCDTTKSVYLAECRKCNKCNRYIGQTARPLRERVAGHRAAYKNKKNMPLYRHLHRQQHQFADLRFTVLETVTNEETLLEREKHWIRQLDTVLPKGLNSQWSLTSCPTGNQVTSQH